ncbi:MAG: hypothetical protein CVV48_07660 [Spirochaetae bacterium HGW-Spirochaetae-4]|nr:MAG: hypothetical protein A2Y31_00215 [Spirochaetes bacterium GWC2_52_13]PKL13339.1 MAG: hypothetical protein CVV52_06390 [Spirochaetae bacterium HGW-Spirochaetae-8]PKL21434.1 MAG: hypothetical protein CVV48_07660 [Spirochaetae bacterium HGW-Spirochaetae-4]
MSNTWLHGLESIAILDDSRSRSINPENPTGAVGEGGKAGGVLGLGRKGRAFLDLPQGKETTLAHIEGPGVINHIWCTVQDRTKFGEFVLRDVILRMYWDDEEYPSVEVPIGDFFCNGFGTKCQINSMPIVVAPYGGFNSFFPMPFKKNARITVVNEHPSEIHAFFYTINYMLRDQMGDDVAYFHAQWRRTAYAKLGEDHIILDDVAGRGHYVGTYLAWTALERYWWGEGEIKFYLDGDTDFPTICGTGVEDYVGGAWGFYERNEKGLVQKNETTYCTPFMGYPFYSAIDGTKTDIYGYDAAPMHGMYRWHIMDAIRFRETLRVTIQQIGHDGSRLFERADDVASTAYWYQMEPHVKFPTLLDREGRRPR